MTLKCDDCSGPLCPEPGDKAHVLCPPCYDILKTAFRVIKGFLTAGREIEEATNMKQEKESTMSCNYCLREDPTISVCPECLEKLKEYDALTQAFSQAQAIIDAVARDKKAFDKLNGYEEESCD